MSEPIKLKTGDLVQFDKEEPMKVTAWRVTSSDVTGVVGGMALICEPVERQPRYGEVWRVHNEYWLRTDRSESPWVLLFSRRGIVAGHATNGWIPNPEKEFFAPSPVAAFERFRSGES